MIQNNINENYLFQLNNNNNTNNNTKEEITCPDQIVRINSIFNITIGGLK
jgi:hypothetical protein